jgi:hypothetical protein
VKGVQEFPTVRVMVDGECSGTIHGFMTFDTPRQVKLLVTKKKTEKLLTSVRKGGLFTVFGWRSLLKAS